jgi:hypothetical protein
MKSKRFLIFFLLFFVGIILLIECVSRRNSTDNEDEMQKTDTIMAQKEVYNRLTDKEIEEGWKLLFNGYSLAGWRGYNMEEIGGGWTVEDGNLVALGKGGDIGGDIITEEEFGSFELALEWKISPGGNSGILYHVVEGDYPAVYATGPEYQIIDDLGFPEPLEKWQTTGANYGMHAPYKAKIKPAGEWNSSRIIIENDHVEHWLNGVKVVEYTLWNDEWNKLVAEGKWKDYPEYGKAGEGHISLQDHGSMTWFRNIKIRSMIEEE